MADITFSVDGKNQEYDWSDDVVRKFKNRFGSKEQKDYLISLAIEKSEKEVLSLGVQVAIKEKHLVDLNPVPGIAE